MCTALRVCMVYSLQFILSCLVDNPMSWATTHNLTTEKCSFYVALATFLHNWLLAINKGSEDALYLFLACCFMKQFLLLYIMNHMFLLLLCHEPWKVVHATQLVKLHNLLSFIISMDGITKISFCYQTKSTFNFKLFYVNVIDRKWFPCDFILQKQ